jgi:DNA-binding transcriptional LysR family regulator
VVPPSHPLARRSKVSISELARESFVAHHVSSPYRLRVIETFKKKRFELRMPVEMPTIDAIKKFVAMGNGVALLPAITVEKEVTHKELVAVQVPSSRSIASSG